jgi:hypothetical protein
MTQTQPIDLDLVDQIVNLIPNDKWDLVRQTVVEKIVDNMPSEILQKLTGSCDDFDQAEERLSNFYADETHEVIIDFINIIGLETSIQILDNLNLISNVSSTAPTEVPAMQGGQTQNN